MLNRSANVTKNLIREHEVRREFGGSQVPDPPKIDPSKIVEESSRGKGGRRCRTSVNCDDDQKLSALLKRWEVADEAPANFRPAVWSRIGTSHGARGSRGNSLWWRLAGAVGETLSRPAYAAALALLTLSLSVGSAHLHAQQVAGNREQRAEAHYLASIDPLAQINPVGDGLID